MTALPSRTASTWPGWRWPEETGSKLGLWESPSVVRSTIRGTDKQWCNTSFVLISGFLQLRPMPGM